MRYNHSAYGATGSEVLPQCDGSSRTRKGGGDTAYARSLKANIRTSDFLKPTAYLAAWVGEHKMGQYRSVQNGALCGTGGIHESIRLKNIYTGPFAVYTAPTLPGFSGFYFGGTASPSAVWTFEGLDRVADMAILGKIKDQKLELGVLLGEAAETANLFCDLTEDLLSIVKFVRTGKRDPLGFMHYLLTKDKRDILNGKPHWPSYERKYKRHASLAGVHRYKDRRFSKRELTFLGVTSQAAANRWMQYRYGAIPVYNDIIAIFDYLITVSQAEPLVTSRVTIPFPKILGINLGPGQHATDVKVEGFQQLKVWYKVSDPKLRNSVQLGIDLQSFPSLLYELTPFSWMLDWAFPIGKSLSALNATRGLSFYCGYRSQKCEVQLNASYIGSNISGVVNSPLYGASAKYGAFQRMVLETFPRVHPPVLENPFGYHTGQRITDCLSILRQFTNFK